MKTSKIVKLFGILIAGIIFSANVYAGNINKHDAEKKVISLSIEKPIVELVAKVLGEQVNSKDIVRMQKVLSQIENVTISFRDEDASDYQLSFDPMSEKQLEGWMFDEGYLTSGFDAETEVSVPWMENIHFNSASETEVEVPVPWMENIHFNAASETEVEVPVPWMDNIHFD